jgi:hypothetical protein
MKSRVPSEHIQEPKLNSPNNFYCMPTNNKFHWHSFSSSKDDILYVKTEPSLTDLNSCLTNAKLEVSMFILNNQDGDEIIIIVTMNGAIFWDVMPGRLTEIHWCFRGRSCLYFQGQRVSQARNQQRAVKWQAGLCSCETTQSYISDVRGLPKLSSYSELLGLLWTLSIVWYVKDKRPQRFGDWICLRPQVDGAG